MRQDKATKLKIYLFRIMNLCQYEDEEGQCGKMVEGRTKFCASHNRLIRWQEQSRIKADEMRKKLLSKPKPVYKKPNKVSDKQRKLLAEYNKLNEQFKIDNPDCKAKIENVCTGATEDTHHSRGRGKYLLDVSSWVPVCRNCHIYIENNPLDAYRRNLSFSRLSEEITDKNTKL